MSKFAFLAAVIALLVAAPVAYAEPGQNGPPGPAGNPNQETTPAPPAQGPPTTPPGNSGSNPHGGPPGITGQQPQTPAAPSNGAGQGGGQSAQHPAPPAQAATPSAPQAATPAGPQGPPAGVPNGSGSADPGAANGGEPNGPDGRITICHATGSATNPFVEITISVNGLNGHGDHQDGEDIVPAPAGGCEPAAVAAATEAVPAGADERGAWPAGDPGADEPGEPNGGVLGEAVFGGTELSGSIEPDGEQVLAADVTGAASAGDDGTGELSKGGELPFTGLAIGGLLIAAALLLASGFGLRHGARGPFASK